MKTVELEVEKIREIRRCIAKQFNFDVAKLGDYYRNQEAALKMAVRPSQTCSEATTRVNETPEN